MPKKRADPELIDGDALDAIPMSDVEDFHRMFNEPGHLIRRLHQISVSIFLDRIREFEVTQIQYPALLTIEVYPGIDQTRLAKTVALDRTTISNVVNRLLTKGLIRREKRNRRTNALFITGSGRAVLHAVSQRVKSVGDDLLDPLTDDERTDFMRLLGKLVDAKNDLSRAPFEPITGAIPVAAAAAKSVKAAKPKPKPSARAARRP